MTGLLLRGFAVLGAGFPLLFAQSAGRLTFQTPAVRVTLTGRLFTPPREAPLVARNQVDRSTPERAYASMRSANTVNDHSWIVENFVASERDEVQKMLADASMERRNWDYYKTIRKAEITGTTFISGFTILLVREETESGTARRIPVTMIQTSAGWMITNALSSDGTFDVVFNALRSGSVQPQK